MQVQTVGQPPSDEVVRIRMEHQKRERMKEALEWLERTGAVIEGGHFRFGRGRDQKHGRKRVVARRLFNRAFVRKWFIPALADAVPRDLWGSIDIVAGPPTLGTIIASDLADYFSSQRETKQPEVEALYFGRNWNDVYELHESDRERLEEGRRVLLVDDVRHRGLTFLACYQAITEAGGRVIATAELIDRGIHVLPLQVPNYFVGQVDQDVLYSPAECPMCREQIPFTKF